MQRSRFNSKKFKAQLALGCGALVLSVCAASPALAQDNDATGAAAKAKADAKDAPPADSAKPADAIVVTGSRIVRSGFKSPTPITVMNQDEIQNQSPTNNIADFVNELPSMAGSTRPQNSRLAISSGLSGVNTLNLRDLGETRTLVLFDGRRSVGSTVTGLVDINTFPQQLIKSVQVVTGGASAAYGSDAVAGVVNFVLDKDFTGLKIDASNGISTYGDGYNASVSVSAGIKFAGGRGHILLSGQYAHQDGIFKVTRKWNAGGKRLVSNPDYTASNGQPKYLVLGPGGTNSVMPGGIINSGALKGTYFGAGGSVNQYDYGTAYGSVSIGGDYALADDGRNIGLTPDDDRRNFYGRVSYDVTDWATVWAEGSYSWDKSLFNSGPNRMSSVTLQSDNAYLLQALGADALAGISSVTLGTTASDLPYRENNNERNVQRYALGADGTFQAFGHNATWSAHVQYGVTHTHEQLNNIQNTANLAKAEDAVYASDGSIVCRSTLTDPTNGCVPLDLIGTGVASQAAIDYVLGNPYRNQKFQQTDAAINLSVTPFSTWAGDVSVAVGGEYRREQVSGYVPTEYQSGWSVGNYLPTSGSYDVKEAYLETVVPLGLGVVFNGAVRATDYSTSGYVTTWKLGATWQPVRDIMFRATRSRDIRAPNLSELYQAGTSRTNTLTDPFTGQTATFLETTTGNPNLKPEKADSTVLGAVLTPRFLPGLSFSADWFQIKIKDAISQYYSQDIIDRCYEGYTNFCSGYTTDPSGTYDYLFSASPFNFNRVTTRGIDLDLSYAMPLGKAGSMLIFHGLATHYIDNIVDDGITTPVDTAGSNGGSGPPSWSYRASITYDTPKFSVTGVAHGISAGTYSNYYIECTSNCPDTTGTVFSTISDNHVSGSFYVDANFTAKIGHTALGDMQWYLNVSNLFNQSPILLPESGLAANSTYSDLIGRSFRVGVRIKMF